MDYLSRKSGLQTILVRKVDAQPYLHLISIKNLSYSVRTSARSNSFCNLSSPAIALTIKKTQY